MRFVGGIAILLIGAIMLLQTMGIVTGDVWGYFWAIILVIIGVAMIYAESQKKS